MAPLKTRLELEHPSELPHDEPFKRLPLAEVGEPATEIVRVTCEPCGSSDRAHREIAR